MRARVHAFARPAASGPGNSGLSRTDRAHHPRTHLRTPMYKDLLESDKRTAIDLSALGLTDDAELVDAERALRRFQPVREVVDQHDLGGAT